MALPLALALPAHRWARAQVERWRWHETELPALPLRLAGQRIEIAAPFTAKVGINRA